MKKSLEKRLMINEQVVKTVEFTKILFTPGAIFLALMVIGSFSADSFADALIGLFGGVFFAVVLSIPAIRLQLFDVLAVTDKRVIAKVGFIRSTEMNSPIHQIQNVQTSSGLLGKIFGYGNIIITTTTGVYNFKYVKKPNDFKDTVIAQISKSEEHKMDLNAEKIAKAIMNNQ